MPFEQRQEGGNEQQREKDGPQRHQMSRQEKQAEQSRRAEIAGRRPATTLGGVRADDGSRGEHESLADGEPAKTEYPVADRYQKLKQPVDVDPGPSGGAHG